MDTLCTDGMVAETGTTRGIVTITAAIGMTEGTETTEGIGPIEETTEVAAATEVRTTDSEVATKVKFVGLE